MTDCDAKEIDVYLLAGQSNMVGGAARIGDLPKTHNIPTEIPHAYWVEGKTIAPLTLGKTSENAFCLGPEIGFALELATKERPVYIIKYAVNGRPLHPGWDGNHWRGVSPMKPGVNFYPGLNPKDESRGKLYKEMMHLCRQSLKFLKSKGYTPKVRALVWMQGEQDAKREESARDYAANLKLLRSRVCEDLGLNSADFPIVFGKVLPRDPVLERFKAYKTIRTQMAAADQGSGMPEAIPNVKMIKTSSFSLRHDRVHFDGPGQLGLGRAFAKAIRKMNKM